MAPRIVSVAIPFKVEPAADGAGVDVRLLMVSSRKHPLRWIFPKGGWEEELGETLCGAAIREAGEEAGIVAGPIALDTAPFLTRDDAAGKCRYHFFSLPVASLAPTWLEAAERSREWVSVAEAGARLEAWVVKKKSELAEGLALWVAWWEREGRDAHLRQLGAAAADSNK